MSPSQPAKIHVFAVINPERTSGADMMLLDALRRLDRDRFRITLGLLTSNSHMHDFIPSHMAIKEFRMRHLNGLAWLRFFLHLCWYLAWNKIHLLHVNSYVPGNYARLAAWLMRVPIIIDYWHGFTRFNPKRRFICRFLERGTDLSLAGLRRESGSTSSSSLTFLLLKSGSSITALICPISAATGTVPRCGVLWGSPPMNPVVGVVARLDHWAKGHAELFQGLARVRSRYPLRCLVIGGGRRQPEMVAMVRELSLTPFVDFLGHRDDIPDLLAALDIFVLPSHSEGISRSLLEAMAAGLPVVVTDVGGSPEVVQPEIDGLLIPAKDPSALAQALVRLLSRPCPGPKIRPGRFPASGRQFFPRSGGSGIK